MRKFYLFFAGAFLALPMVAQNEPIRNPETDPKEIYLQDFEDDWDDWSTAVVDTINGLDYYKTKDVSTSSKKIWEDKNYQTGFVHRDTVIEIFNGVKKTGSDSDIAKGAFDGDTYNIITDSPEDFSRQQALDQYGTKGGTHYFQYFAGDGSKAGNASNGLVPEYRRNLFIRLTPGAIEENSSYRITMYLKTTKLTNGNGEKNSTPATFRAEFMRGFFNSEKNFSMGRDNNNVFTYSKDDFEDGKWTKITYMSYFLTNEIANEYCYYGGYYSDWGNAWKWKGAQVAAAGFDSLCIIRQPNKFFLRVSFRGDSTIYDLDNMSITKSTIGGIQHTGNLIRVDFGYETNLKDQALAAKARTNVPAVELPGQFFTVRGYKASTNKWQKIGISTAEYHDDGYLYMWAKPGAGGTQIKFENYDTVLVSFTNPTGVEYDTLSLKYSGSLYPNALDEAWVNAGKKVFDFTNEVSTPNPNIATGVYQMKNYPPVMRPNGAPYENGSFGLPTTLDSIRLVLSRKIEFDADETEGSGEKAFMKVYKDGVLKEIWPVSQSTDTWTTFKRQAKDKGTPLSGDYTFEVVQMKGVGDAKYSTFEIKLDYSFGDFDKNVLIDQVKSDWRSEITETGAWDRPVPPSLYTWNNNDGFYQGTGKNFSPYKKNGLYKMVDDGVNGDALFYLSAYKKGEIGRLWTVVHLKAGDWTIKFPAFGWARGSLTTRVYVFPKPSEMEYSVLTSAEENEIGSFNAKNNTSWSGNSNERTWDGDAKGYAQMYEFPFKIATEGDYVVEWTINHDGSQGYYGVALGNFLIKVPAKDMSSNYVSMVNWALKRAEEKKAFVDAAERKYKGDAYTAMTTIAANVKASIFNETAPSKYEAAATSIDDAIKAMQVRMDTVDLYYTAIDTVNKALTAKAAYSSLDAYAKLRTLKTTYESYDCSQHTSKEISAVADALNGGIENLLVRIKKNDGFEALLDSAKKIIDSTFVLFKAPKLEGKDLFEHDTLNQVYEAALAKKATAGTLSDSAFYALYDGVDALLKGYMNGMDAVVARTRQIRELYALAVDSLGYDFGGKKDSIKTLVSELRKRDVALENVIREAAVLQILKKYAAGETVGFGAKDSKGNDSVDVSVLIPNYFLANDGVAGVNMEKKGDVWVVKSVDNVAMSAIPGWNFLSISGDNGYWLPTTVKVGDGDGHMDWEADGHAFIGGLRCGPKTAGTIETADTVVMPTGLYDFGLFGYNQTSNVALEIISDSCKVGTDDKSSLNNVFNNPSGKFNYKKVVKDSVKLAGKTLITIKQTSGSSSEFDIRYFILTLRGKLKGVDYAALAKAQEAKLAEMITFVAPIAVAADPIAVQYFNLNGVQVLAPEAGKVVIKRTILSNGKSVVEKILVK